MHTNSSFISAAVSGVLERLVLHHVAPVARAVADRDEQRPVFALRARERLARPTDTSPRGCACAGADRRSSRPRAGSSGVRSEAHSRGNLARGVYTTKPSVHLYARVALERVDRQRRDARRRVRRRARRRARARARGGADRPRRRVRRRGAARARAIRRGVAARRARGVRRPARARRSARGGVGGAARAPPGRRRRLRARARRSRRGCSRPA